MDKYYVLSSGARIPRIGLGVFQSEKGEVTESAVACAINRGYRHIDAAKIYGNEESVGNGIRRSGIKRSEIFLTTKIWNADILSGKTEEAFTNSLDALKTDYVDLYLIHWPVGDFCKTWKDLEKIYKSGRAKAIGVSNFRESDLDKLLSICEVKPMVNQIERNPYMSQKPLIKYLNEKDIYCEAWSPLGGTGGNILLDPEINRIAAKYGKSAAQLIIRWDLQGGLIVIPKSVHANRIKENIDVFDFEISDEDMAAIDALNRDTRVGPSPEGICQKWHL